MATEPKENSQQQLPETDNATNDEANALEIFEQMIKVLPGLLGDMALHEQSEESPVLKSFDLAGAAAYMANCSNVIVMCGAGISTSAGIPDFRTPGTGLYSQLEKYNLPFPEAIFQMDYFRQNPKPFFLLAKELFPKKFTPTPTHYFFKLLEEKGKLLRIFTQNIDSLERIAGIPTEKIVEAHGSFFTAHCLECRKEYSLEHIQKIIFNDEVPYCDDCKGIIKPDIVFFGESLPARFAQCTESDFPKADFLIILGTSLQVAPFNTLISRVNKDCPRLLINMESVGSDALFWIPFTSMLMFDSPKNRRDVFHKSACDDGVMELAKLLGWERDFNRFLKKDSTPSQKGADSSGKTTTLDDKNNSGSTKVSSTSTNKTSAPTKSNDKNASTRNHPTTVASTSARRNSSPSKAGGTRTRTAISPSKKAPATGVNASSPKNSLNNSKSTTRPNAGATNK